MLVGCVSGGVVKRIGGGGGGHTRIVTFEPQHHIPVRVQHHRVPLHGNAREVGRRDVGVGKGAGLVGRAPDDLELVAVQVERVLARVEIVQHDVDDLVLLKNEGVGVGSIHCRVIRVFPCGEGGVERRHFRGDVGDVVEEGAGGVLARMDDLEMAREAH